MSTATDKPPSTVLVWDLPVRLFHWALAGSFAVAYVTAESEQGSVHFVAGYLFAALLVFRLVWGLVGTRYARFTEFLRSPGAAFSYLRSYVSGNAPRFLGHNPAGAIAILLMLGLGAAIAVTGWLNLTGQENDLLEEAHEILANTMLAVVVVHIVGVIVSSRMHGENLARSMVTGRKEGTPDAAIPRARGAVALLLALALGGFGWALAQGHLPTLLDPAQVAAHGEHGEGGEGGEQEGDDD